MIWDLAGQARAALASDDVSAANAYADSALARLADSDLRSDPEAAFLAIDVDRLAADARWAAGRAAESLGSLHAARTRYDAIVDGRLADPGRLSPALRERLAEPMIGLYRDLADRLVAVGETDSGWACGASSSKPWNGSRPGWVSRRRPGWPLRRAIWRTIWPPRGTGPAESYSQWTGPICRRPLPTGSRPSGPRLNAGSRNCSGRPSAQQPSARRSANGQNGWPRRSAPRAGGGRGGGSGRGRTPGGGGRGRAGRDQAPPGGAAGGPPAGGRTARSRAG